MERAWWCGCYPTTASAGKGGESWTSSLPFRRRRTLSFCRCCCGRRPCARGCRPRWRWRRRPTVTLLAEDLPQLFIQGLYLVLSRDIGNYVVISSVGLSGCCLLLRFAKAAMHMLRWIGCPDSRLVETSPIRTWDDTKFSRWIQVMASAARTEGSQELSKALDNLSAWTVSQLLSHRRCSERRADSFRGRRERGRRARGHSPVGLDQRRRRQRRPWPI